MSMNRLDRDTICQRGLNLADSAALDNKDRPAGTIVAGAYSITWLQEALDYVTKQFPFSADITSVAFSLATGANTFTVPSDFVLDYYNGVLLDAPNEARLLRRGLNKILNTPVSSSGAPTTYCVRGSTVQVSPKVDKAYTGLLYYYKLPAVLAATDVPIFPDDYILVTYVWLKAKEWHNAVPPGTAMKYADSLIKELQKSGIGNEAEDDQLGIDPAYAGEYPNDPTAWMGRTVPS